MIGPAFSRHGNSSEAFVSEILNGGYPGVPTPSTQYATVDVRDAALAHILALEHPEAAGKRYIVSGFSLQTHEVFNLLREKYAPQGYKVPTAEIDAEGIKKSGHGPSLRVLPFLGRKFCVNNSRAIQ